MKSMNSNVSRLLFWTACLFTASSSSLVFGQSDKLITEVVDIASDAGVLRECLGVTADVAGALPLVDVALDRVGGFESDEKQMAMAMESLNRKADLTIEKLDSVNARLLRVKHDLDNRLSQIPSETANLVQIYRFSTDSYVLAKSVLNEKRYNKGQIDQHKSQLFNLISSAEALSNTSSLGKMHYMVGCTYLSCAMAHLLYLERQNESLDRNYFVKNSARLKAVAEKLEHPLPSVIATSVKSDSNQAMSVLRNRGFTSLASSKPEDEIILKVSCFYRAEKTHEFALFSLRGIAQTREIVKTPERTEVKHYAVTFDVAPNCQKASPCRPIKHYREITAYQAKDSPFTKLEVKLPDESEFDTYVSDTVSTYNDIAVDAHQRAFELAIAEGIQHWKSKHAESIALLNKYCDSPSRN